MAYNHSISGSGEEWLISVVGSRVRNFVDVGANVGAWSIAMARKMGREPKGLLFEPSPETAARLRSVVAAAGFEKLEVVQSALGERKGQATFYSQPSFGELSGLFASSDTVKSIVVPLTTLDNELAARNIDQVDFLKIDAEGNDYNVMLGGEAYISTRRINMIQFEYNETWAHAGSTLTRAYEFLRDCGYKVRLLKPGFVGELDVRKSGEYFKYSNFVAYWPNFLGDVLDRQNHVSVL